MRTIFITIFILYFIQLSNATSYTIVTSGYTYPPSDLTVNVGDQITISASTMHPLTQVDLATWTANSSTAVSGGWGVQTSDYTFTASAAGLIYFVCQNHVGIGMKGKITVQDNATQIALVNTQGFSIYPNPAKTFAIISLPSKVDALIINVYNSLGAVQKSVLENSNGGNQIELNLENLSSGIYFVRIEFDKKLLFRVLFVEK